MSTPAPLPTAGAERRSHGAGAFPAWLLFIGLITLEYLVISFRIDAKDLLIPTGLQGWLGEVGTLAPLGFVIALATYFAGGRAARMSLTELRMFRSSRWALVFWGALHATAYVTSFFVVAKVKRDAVAQAPSSRVWAFSWFALLLASALSLAASFWSLPRVAAAFRLARRGIGIGSVVGLAAFGAGLLSRLLWSSLARLTLELVHAMLTIVVPDPVAAPEELLVGTARFFVEIAPVCSGVEGIGLTLTFMGVYLYLCRADLRWPRAFAMLPVSVVAIWLLNIVRIFALILVGTWGWPDVALGGFHSKAGWVFFTMVALGAVVITQRMPLFRKVEHGELSTEGTRGASENTAAPYLMPLLAVLAVALLTGLASSGFDRLYPLRVVAALIAIWVYRRRLPRLSFSRPWLALGVGLGVGLIWSWGTRGGDPEARKVIAGGLGQLPSTLAVLWMVARVVGSALMAPVVEELAFRGFLMRRLASREFEGVSFRHVHWVALAGSSLAFGLLHPQWWLGIVAGAAYGLVTVPYGRLSDAVLAHATTNATLVAFALATRDWSLLS